MLANSSLPALLFEPTGVNSQDVNRCLEQDIFKKVNVSHNTTLMRQKGRVQKTNCQIYY